MSYEGYYRRSGAMSNETREISTDSTDENNTRKILLAIDVGSSSVRCTAYEWGRVDESVDIGGICNEPGSALGSTGVGTLIGLVQSARKLRASHPITGKINAKGIIEAVETCVDEILIQIRQYADQEGIVSYQIISVGLTSFVMNLVGVGEEGELINDEATISYACNTDEVSDDVTLLRREMGEDRMNKIYEKTGAPVHNAYALSQLRVFYSRKPAISKLVQKWQTIASICLATWTHQNNLPISYSEASWTGLLNYQTCQYEQSVLDLLPEDCCNALPDLADYDEPDILRNGIPQSSPYYNRWPALRNTRFFLGLGDGACANIGSKCTIPTRIACTVGTSAACRVCLPLKIGSSLRFEPGLFCYRIDRAHVVLGGSLTDGGSVVEWTRQLLNLESPDDFEQMLGDIEDLMEEQLSSERTHPHLTFIPFLNGERSTGFRGGATGAMLGLTRAVTPAHFVKACIEGVTLRMGAVIRLLQKSIHSESLPRIIASGKALEANSLWRQALADCTGLEVIFDHETHEGTSRGVACLSAAALGLSTEDMQHGLVLEVVNLSRVAKPRSTHTAYWERAINAQEEAITALTPMYETS